MHTITRSYGMLGFVTPVATMTRAASYVVPSSAVTRNGPGCSGRSTRTTREP
ncbi:hypothetical protein ACGFJC_12200 [Nonomuraea fuscirosea]|uniref:hypothetical protein n=1 Tax=Nonomuraea fuscirosea TaxID=1291556 RepID=UPI0034365799